MKLSKLALIPAALALVLASACGGGKKDAEVAKNPDGKPKVGVGGTVVEKAANDKFTEALTAMNDHDKSNDWNDGVCTSVARLFEEAVELQSTKKFPEATYNAGLSYQRCAHDKDARGRFEQALKAEPKFHYARAQLALYDFKANGEVDHAIGELERAVSDANFQNVPALVNLAMFQMLRDSKSVGLNCKTRRDGKEVDLEDFECAKLNLQRALAIADDYMPAFNQLALYYFTAAKKRAGQTSAGGGAKGGARFGRTVATNAAIGKRADVQQLELAALVCSQAINKDVQSHNKKMTYAPIHNTAGLILNELGQTNGSVREFQAAVALDPKFFEAHMNLAAINLSFRGFDKAEASYRKALEMQPNDYDAHLGLALALRGQIDDANYDRQVAAVQAELDACKKLNAGRPDAYYNEGILTQEYRAKSGGDNKKTIAVLTDAKKLFQTFMEKAGGNTMYDGAVKKSKERVEDIDQTIAFLNDTPAAAPPAPSPTPPTGAPPGATPGPGAGQPPSPPAPAPK